MVSHVWCDLCRLCEDAYGFQWEFLLGREIGWLQIPQDLLGVEIHSAVQLGRFRYILVVLLIVLMGKNMQVVPPEQQVAAVHEYILKYVLVSTTQRYPCWW